LGRVYRRWFANFLRYAEHRGGYDFKSAQMRQTKPETTLGIYAQVVSEHQKQREILVHYGSNKTN